MASIKSIQAKCFSIPSPFKMTSSMHGELNSFELVTAAVRDEDAVEGVGYTLTVGSSGAAIATLINAYLTQKLVGLDADLIEQCWQRMWWALHYGGRGGPVSMAISAVDMALWDLKARRLKTPLWRLLGGHDPKVPVYVGAIDLHLGLKDILKETDKSLDARFPGDQDKGRAEEPGRGRRQGPRTTQASWPGNPADGRREYALDG